ncbi:MAG: ATP-binding protein, partial [Acidobacteriota bacterium]
GRLLRRTFVIALLLVSGGLITSGLVELFFRYRESVESIGTLQREMAQAAAFKIQQFIQEIEKTMGAATQTKEIVAAGLTEDYRFELIKLLKVVPAVSEAAALDAKGREQIKVSRVRTILPEDLRDRSSDEAFVKVRGGKSFFSPVYFVRDSEPYMTIAVPIERLGEELVGVLVAEVNLKYIWEVVSRIKVGQAGYAYVVSREGDLVAHPDISLVLQKRNLGHLSQVKAALADVPGPLAAQPNLAGQKVFPAYAPIPDLGWAVLVERPAAEAYAPLYASILRSSVLLLLGFGMAVLASLLIGRRVVRPVEVLRQGAARIGAGALDHRIDVRTGDELEVLAESFNRMTAQLRESYASLERKVVETRSLYEIGQEIAAQIALEPTLHLIVERARDLSRAEVSLLALRQEGSDTFAMQASSGTITEAIAGVRFRPGEGLGGRVVVTGMPILVGDYREEFPDSPSVEIAQEAGFRSGVAVPLKVRDVAIGVLYVHSRAAHKFREEDQQLLSALADQAAIAIDKAKLYQDLQHSHQELLAAQAELVRKTRMAAMGEIAAVVAHETRNPLGALNNCVQLLRMNPHITGEDAELLDILQTESQRLNQIVSDFLAFGRPRPPQFQEVDLHELIDETLALLQRDDRCPPSIISIRKFDPSLPKVWIDPDQLRQVVWNLAVNAVQAMGGEGEVRVETRRVDSQMDILVQDTGPGIPRNVLPNIFEPFYSTKSGGTGLGLPIVRRIVEEHGGQISVESEEEVGTCFTVALPLESKRH